MAMSQEPSRRSMTLLATTLAVFTLAGCGGAEAEITEPTFTAPPTFEDLDLSSPQAAVAEFESAFLRRDYVTAGLILHRDTQATMEAAFPADDLRGVITPDVQASLLARISLERDGDHFSEAGRIFEIAMEEAMGRGGFIVDLASGADGYALRSSDRFSAVVEGILATNGNDVVFELAPSADGRWRIRSVRLANGLPGIVPFSGTPSIASPQRPSEPTEVWRDALPNATPQELLDTIVTLLEAGDHVSLYLLLDSTAQQGVHDQLSGSVDPDHAFVAPMLDTRLDANPLPIELDDVGNVSSETMAVSRQVSTGEAMTFMIPHGDDGLDVTMSRDSTGGWRLRRLVTVGSVAAPSPFAIPTG